MVCRAQDQREKQSDWDGSWSIRGPLGALTLCGRVQGQTLAVEFLVFLFWLEETEESRTYQHQPSCAWEGDLE